MSKLIDAGKLKEYVNSISNGLLCEWDTLGVLGAIDKQQAVDAVPVVHGHYVSSYEQVERFCSNCGHNEPYKFADTNADVFYYCPHCGAKMDEKDGEGLRPSELANRIGVSRSMVSKWLSGASKISSKREDAITYFLGEVTYAEAKDRRRIEEIVSTMTKEEKINTIQFILETL